MKQIRHLMGLELKVKLKRTIILSILVLTFCSTIFSSGAVGQEDSENNQPVSEEGFFYRFITYVKSLFSGEGELQSSGEISKTGAADMWWWYMPPGICITLCVLSIALIGFGLEAKEEEHFREGVNTL